ncbi:Flagella-related protein FlaI [Methanosarcina sp. MTP4]|uniref:type II/IV secretion system ATPase subunit n=1 Tax=Methanosarcina sp. MTP4 TaxID=1434100 RepID=UPI00061574DD|nr:type II/IV secretion system ATPase subunit [Methanosarcina sp. MTP4]AKB25733.1 Flagella-related protein FlaI [Methanosarcina sp. MTP4]
MKITRALKGLEHPNLIYAVDNGVPIHIYPDREDIRDYYVPIEPTLGQDIERLLMDLEEIFVDLVDGTELEAETPEERETHLLELIERTCVIREDGAEQKGTWFDFLNKVLKYLNQLFKLKNIEKIYVTPREYQAIKYIILRDKVGLGVLEPLLKDPYIEDISCSGLGHIFVEHKIFSGLKTMITFKDMGDLNSFVVKVSEKIGKPITYRDPIVDATLPDGSRINIVFGEDVSKRGSNFTIRKFAGTPLSILDLIEFGSLDYTIAAYLWILLKQGMSCFIAGETASGKTTLLNALTTFLPPDGKVVSIEDTPELQVPLKNWTREVTRASREESNSEVSMFDLLRAALRQRPNEIMIGEIRGVEGNIAFQAMQTGHPVMSTFHASSVEKLIQRITGDPINVPKTYMDNLNLVICQNAIHLPGKGMIRRVTSVNEIVGYDPVSDTFSFIEVFRWDSSTDSFEFVADMNSYLLENRIAPKLGIPENQTKKIYKDIERRERILRKLHEAKVTGFYDLFAMMIKIEEEGLI